MAENERARIERLQKKMAEEGLDALVCRLSENVVYLTDYWPHHGFSVALLPRSGKALLFVPEVEVGYTKPEWADVTTFGWGLLKDGDLYENYERLLSAALAQFDLKGKKVGVGQLELATLDQVADMREALLAAMKEQKGSERHSVLLMLTDVVKEGTDLVVLSDDPALIEVVDVIPVDGMIANITDGNVIIAYTRLNPIILAENEVVVTLKVKAISPFTSAESMFTIGQNSEFADGTAKVVEPVTLKSFGVTTDPAATDYFLSANRPNPFSNSTFIEYTMPESGKVKLSVLDMLGQEIAVLVDATQGAGSYTVEFSAAGLATGVYIYKITVDGESRDFISTQRMVISH